MFLSIFSLTINKLGSHFTSIFCIKTKLVFENNWLCFAPVLENNSALNFERSPSDFREHERSLFDGVFVDLVSRMKFVCNFFNVSLSKRFIVIKSQKHGPSVMTEIALSFLGGILKKLILVTHHELDKSSFITEPLTFINELRFALFKLFLIKLLSFKGKFVIYFRNESLIEESSAHRARVVTFLHETLLTLHAEEVATLGLYWFNTESKTNRAFEVGFFSSFISLFRVDLRFGYVDLGKSRLVYWDIRAGSLSNSVIDLNSRGCVSVGRSITLVQRYSGSSGL